MRRESASAQILVSEHISVTSIDWMLWGKTKNKLARPTEKKGRDLDCPCGTWTLQE